MAKPHVGNASQSTTNPNTNPQHYHEQAKAITTLRSGKEIKKSVEPPPQNVEESVELEKMMNLEK